MTERSIEDILSNGAGYSAPSSASGGFNVGSRWDGYYNFNAIGGKLKGVEGNIPIPSQAKIDRWQKAVGYLGAELEDAAARQAKARAELGKPDSELTLEERKAEVDEAAQMWHDVVEKFRDALADVCSGSPTRPQLGNLPQNWVLEFVSHVSELLNPNV